LVIIGVFFIWSATPWALVALAWRKWARTKVSLMEDLIDDPAFLFGQILATVSCCSLVPLYITATTATYRWGHSHMEVLEYGVIISLVSGLIAVFILPFGLKHAKWLSFVSCLLNTGVVLLFVVVESA
jgi:hypothetical protein